MIKVIAKMSIKEDKVEGLINSILGSVEETRKEAGCMEYNLFQDVNIRNEFTFVEEWDSPEALKSHMNSKHFQEMISKLTEIMNKEMEVSVCTQVL